VQSGTAGSNHALALRNSSNNFSRLGFLQTDSATAAYTSIDGDGRASGYLKFNTNDTERMRIDASGVVKIGGQTGTLQIGNDATYYADIEWEYNNNELAFSTNSGANFTFNSGGTERMRIDSSGRVTTPNQPSFTGTGLFPSTSGAYVDLNTNIRTTNIHHNVGSHFNNSTGVFTCPVAGMYSVFASLLIDDDSGTSELCRANWRKNGSPKFWIYDNQRSVSTPGRYEGMAVTGGLIQCAANDTITLVAVGGAFHAAGESTFSIHLIG
jgi:hypothetical protein